MPCSCWQLFVSRVGTKLDTSNATKMAQRVWRAALGDEVQVPNFTARGVRFGAVMATAEDAPDEQE